MSATDKKRRPVTIFKPYQGTRPATSTCVPFSATVTANGYTETIRGFQYLSGGVRPGQTVITFSKEIDFYYAAETPTEGITAYLEDLGLTPLKIEINQ